MQIHSQPSILLKGEANLIYKQVKNNISETCDNPLKPQRDFSNELPSRRRVTMPPLSEAGRGKNTSKLLPETPHSTEKGIILK
ncbi:hypothetical protein CEXT_176101 [Caerostris extrusa]|uniref:Uncharacterized protein n=1 Tax=Caerostris extrusa TaxID=172846 RepID=A0AAV4NZB5_CAEEX|nr:hypothetical protein CEXT_176101 [Caerostris extrusa]